MELWKALTKKHDSTYNGSGLHCMCFAKQRSTGVSYEVGFVRKDVSCVCSVTGHCRVSSSLLYFLLQNKMINQSIKETRL